MMKRLSITYYKKKLTYCAMFNILIPNFKFSENENGKENFMKKGLLVLTLVGLLGITSCDGKTSTSTSVVPNEEAGFALLEAAVGAIESNYTIEVEQTGIEDPFIFKVTEEGIYSSLAAEEGFPGLVVYEGKVYEYYVEEGEACFYEAYPLFDAEDFAELYNVAGSYVAEDFEYLSVASGVYSFAVVGAFGEIIADAAGVFNDYEAGTISLIVTVDAAGNLTGKLTANSIQLFTTIFTDIDETVIPEFAVVNPITVYTLQSAFAELGNKNFSVFIEDWKHTYYNPQGLYIDYQPDAINQGAVNYGLVNYGNAVYRYTLNAQNEGVLGAKASNATDIYEAVYSPYDLYLFEIMELELFDDGTTLFDLFFYDEEYDCYYMPLEELIAEEYITEEEEDYIKELFGNLISIQTAYSDVFVEIDIYVDMFTAELYIQCIFPYQGSYVYSDCTIGDIGVTTVPGLSNVIA